MGKIAPRKAKMIIKLLGRYFGWLGSESVGSAHNSLGHKGTWLRGTWVGEGKSPGGPLKIHQAVPNDGLRVGLGVFWTKGSGCYEELCGVGEGRGWAGHFNSILPFAQSRLGA